MAKAFTLLEILIAVSVLAIVVTVALPSYVRSRERAQNTQTAGTLRVFAGQMESFNVDERGWPDDTLPGRFPLYMNGQYTETFKQSVKEQDWYTGPAIGGEYDWDIIDSGGIYSAMAVANPTASTEQLERLDVMIDDGNLSSGALREVSGGLIYVVSYKK